MQKTEGADAYIAAVFITGLYIYICIVLPEFRGCNRTRSGCSAWRLT